MSQYGSVKAYGWELNRCRDATVRVSTYVDVGKQLLDISENDCRDVAVLRLYKGFRQRIIKFGRCLLNRIDLCPT